MSEMCHWSQLSTRGVMWTVKVLPLAKQTLETSVTVAYKVRYPSHPLSNTNRESHILSRLRSSRWPQLEYGSTSSKPSSNNAFFAVMQSDLGT